MKIEPKAAPSNNNSFSSASSNAAADAKARAIAMLTTNSSTPQEAQAKLGQQQAPVQNPTRVSAEELSAITSNGQPNPGETQSEQVAEPEVTKAAPKEDKLSAQYALLARKEKSLRAKVQQQDAALKDREAKLAAREAAIAAKDAEYQTKYIPRDRLSQDPLSVLSEAGISYDQITSAILNSPKPENMEQLNALNELKAELKAVKEAQEAANKAAADAHNESYNQALSQIRRDATTLVNSNPEYETIKETKQVGEVVRLIEQTFKDEGYVMDVEEACQLVEAEIVERFLETAKINKLRSKLQPATPAPAQKSAASETQSKPQSQNTLTNAISSTRPLSAKERAILAFQGKLQK